jgi:hypothetical protein
MKKFFAIFAIAAFAVACAGTQQPKAAEETVATDSVEVVAATDSVVAVATDSVAVVAE